MTARLSPQREVVIVEQIKQALSEAGAFCGECGFEPGDRGCRDCEGCWKRYADDLLPIVREAVVAELAAVRAERDEAELMRDFYRHCAVQLVNQRGEAEVANEAWELGKITAEEALRRTDAAIQSHKAVTLDQFRAEREARS